MSFRHKIILPIIFFILVILIGAGVFLGITYLLPGLLESKLISILKKDVGISELTLNLRELDLEGADLGPLRLGSPQNPAIIVRSLQVDYAPRELYRQKIKKVVASGVELYVEYKNGQLGLRGFDLPKFLSQLKAKLANDPVSDKNIPIFPNHVEINNGLLIGVAGEKTYRLAFEMDILPREDTKHMFVAAVRLYPRGIRVDVLANIDIQQNQITSELNASDLELSRFADLWQPVNGLSASGSANLTLKTQFGLKPFEISAIRGHIGGSAVNIKYKDLHFQVPTDTANQPQPFSIDFVSPRPGGIKVTLSHLAMRTPLAARLSNFAVTLNSSDQGTRFFGHFRLSSVDTNDTAIPVARLKFNKPFDCPLKFSGYLSQNHQWRIELTGDNPKQFEQHQTSFQYHQNHISFKLPTVDLSARGVGRLCDLTYELKVPAVRLTSESVNIFSPQLVLTGETNLSADPPRRGITKFNLDGPGSVVTTPSGTIKLRRLSMGGRLQRDQRGKLSIAGQLKFADTRFEENRANIALHGAQGSIPFQFPAAILARKGMISIKHTTLNQLDLGAVQAEVEQTASGLSFNGALQHPILPALVVEFSGTSDFENTTDYQTRARFTISYPPTAPEIDLGKFLPAAAGLTFSGRLWEQGEIVIGRNGMQATAKSGVQNGTLRHRENQIAVEGIQTEVLIQDLVKVRSAPGQKLKFARASLGEMNIDNGEIDFQIESARSFLIEKSHFIWCDGNVDAPAIRFKPGINDYQLILYCDRLNLAKVLEQFGAASVEAEGELNGRIPLRYRNGLLSFADGFLYTTPGQSGKIRMKDTQMLTAGIPPDTPQYVQMELARKALEDYDYTWAKLNLTTEGEDLLLKMQLDGKPAQSLPFVYQKDIGGFAKVEAGVQGSTFQGIRLDVNFRLPLNKIMQYQELIKMIQKSREP
jgi:hypothetical protein